MRIKIENFSILIIVVLLGRSLEKLYACILDSLKISRLYTVKKAILHYNNILNDKKESQR